MQVSKEIWGGKAGLTISRELASRGLWSYRLPRTLRIDRKSSRCDWYGLWSVGQAESQDAQNHRIEVEHLPRHLMKACREGQLAYNTNIEQVGLTALMISPTAPES